MFHRWLVAHDFEPCADAAVDAAARVALACRSGDGEALLVLAHVVTPPALPMSTDVGGGTHVLAVIDLLLKAARERLAEVAAQVRLAHPGLTVDTVVLSGSPTEALLDEAERRGVDALALGSHGRRGLAHAFLGSVAERVVQRSPRPVFVLKAAPTPVLATT